MAINDIAIAQTQETLGDVSIERPCTQHDFGKVNLEIMEPSPPSVVRPKSSSTGLPTVRSQLGDASEDKIVPEGSAGIEDVSIFNSHVHEGPTDGAGTNVPEVLQEEATPRQPVLFCECTRPSPMIPSDPPSQEDYTNSGPRKSRWEAHAESTNLEHHRRECDLPVTLPSPTPTFPDKNDMDLEYEGEFYMLGVPEILTLPWEPVASQIYVHPGLGHLISGMKRQLRAETQARQRAEELYQTELRRRVAAEQITQGRCVTLHIALYLLTPNSVHINLIYDPHHILHHLPIYKLQHSRSSWVHML
ncbi:hypothetical protein BS17DRAFT_21917 [Gyrodon lividus]|nr:hypothetical protein BS17DRAFT_21917 [Gyrodon lividus]